MKVAMCNSHVQLLPSGRHPEIRVVEFIARCMVRPAVRAAALLTVGCCARTIR